MATSRSSSSAARLSRSVLLRRSCYGGGQGPRNPALSPIHQHATFHTATFLYRPPRGLNAANEFGFVSASSLLSRMAPCPVLARFYSASAAAGHVLIYIYIYIFSLLCSLHS
ncbi:hypothetical protein BUALT_Bualt18G0000300 [Buddleja alternifolia]|uniref:Uncharacterized protein n=1 Tax=Buddleja alternifolia TaxID=168488 RepID=A0AAV6W1B8_9LAMI|nr:hypothetical protein BUALT_Bualt18G0000300 [Buddleja alternifolia]